MHGALWAGMMETDWEIHKVFHAMWEILDEPPARRDIYTRENGCDIYPSHFCKARCIKDVTVWAIQIWPNIAQVVKHWLSLPKSKQPRNNKSFNIFFKYANQLIFVKFHFFLYLASLFSPFLFAFKPVNQWFFSFDTEFDITLWQLISLIVRRKVVTEADTPNLLMKVDLEKKENLVHVNNVEICSAFTYVLAKLSVSDKVKMKFRKVCVAIIVKIIKNWMTVALWISVSYEVVFVYLPLR